MTIAEENAELRRQLAIANNQLATAQSQIRILASALGDEKSKEWKRKQYREKAMLKKNWGHPVVVRQKISKEHPMKFSLLSVLYLLLLPALFIRAQDLPPVAPPPVFIDGVIHGLVCPVCQQFDISGKVSLTSAGWWGHGADHHVMVDVTYGCANGHRWTVRESSLMPEPELPAIQSVNFRPPQVVTQYIYFYFTNTIYVPITNTISITNTVYAQPGALTPMVGSIIDPAQGRRQTKEILGAIALTILPFDPTNWCTVYLFNPERKPVYWPSTNVVVYKTPNGLPPDPTEPYPSLLFESMFGKIFATP